MTAVTIPTSGAGTARVDVLAFVIAAVLAPLSLAAFGVFGLHVGLMLLGISALLSLPGYIVAGLPAAWLAIRRGSGIDGKSPEYGRIAYYSLGAVTALIPLGVLYGVVVNGNEPGEALKGAIGYALAGLLFGPIEALLFAYWYRKCARVEAPRIKPEIFV
ncbi:MAG: hypothetical protein AAGC55_28110 [Myxococcota bacterium]